MTDQRFCPQCGQTNSLTAQFCGHCGQPLPAVQPTGAPPNRWRWFIGGIALMVIASITILVTQMLPERPQPNLAAVPLTTTITPRLSLTPVIQTAMPSATPTTLPTPTDPPTATPTVTAVPAIPEPLLARATENGQVYLGDNLILDMAAEGIGCFGIGDIDYSPTGDHFVVVLSCFEGDNEAFLFRADGSGKQRITSQWDYINYSEYEWSSDGRYFIYQRINSCCADPPPDAPPPGTVRYDVTTGSESSPTPLVSANVTAVQVSTPPIIDGSLTDWPKTTAYLSAHQMFTVRGWDGSDDLTAVWKLTWDDDYLYLGVTVTDDIHVQT